MAYSKIDFDQKLIVGSGTYLGGDIRLEVDSCRGIVLSGRAGSLELKCRDIAAAVWGMHQNRIFFRAKYNLNVHYIADLNGGGTQLIRILKSESSKTEECMMRVTFEPITGNKVWIYEADLFVDSRRNKIDVDNRGLHKFDASTVSWPRTGKKKFLSWLNENYLVWVEDLARLSKQHSTITEWVFSGLDMGVLCSNFRCRRTMTVVSNDDLKKLLPSTPSLEDLQRKFACSKCGSRRPRIIPFLVF